MNIVQLLSLIEERPAIWDKSKRSKETKLDAIWIEIAKIMNLPKRKLRIKWRNLRDQYRRLHRVETLMVTPWPYYDQMSFMKKVLNEEHTVANGVRKEIKISSMDATMSSSTLTNDDLLALDNILEKSNKEDDESASFFNSLLPHMRHLSPQEKLKCHMAIQQLVYNFVYNPDLINITYYDPTPVNNNHSL